MQRYLYDNMTRRDWSVPDAGKEPPFSTRRGFAILERIDNMRTLLMNDLVDPRNRFAIPVGRAKFHTTRRDEMRASLNAMSRIINSHTSSLPGYLD